MVVPLTVCLCVSGTVPTRQNGPVVYCVGVYLCLWVNTDTHKYTVFGAPARNARGRAQEGRQVMIDWEAYYRDNLSQYVLVRWANGTEHLWDATAEWGQWTRRGVVPPACWQHVPVVSPAQALAVNA